jgi:hypothetical protein
VAEAVASAGLREYYHPYTGRGMGAVDFAWSTLVLELLEPDPLAASSYLNGRATVDTWPPNLTPTAKSS